jgi:phosphatidate cytidylyltransferase
MIPRLLLGPVFIGILIALMWLDWWLGRVAAPSWPRVLTDADGTLLAGLPLLVAGVLLCGRAGYELARIFRSTGAEASVKSLTFCAAAGLIASSLTVGSTAPLAGPYTGAVLATAAGASLFLTMLAFVRDRDPRGAAGAVAGAVVAFVYVGLMLGFLMALRRDYEVWVMVAVVLIVKACDIGAYFTGKAIGRHKLIPWLSPGKTWEGLLGGIALSAACGVLMAWLGSPSGAGWTGLEALRHFTWIHGVAFGALLAVIGQLGDLSASVLKRDAGVKDSGNIPGFGGLIDILDSLLIAAPVAYWYLWLLRA